MAVHVIEQRMITYKWCQKQTETGTIPNFQSCAPLHHKKNIIERKIHRLVRCTSNWTNFDEALRVDEKILLKNQYPESWSSKVVIEALQKILTKPKQLNKPVAQNTSNESSKKKNNEIPSLFLQYRGNLSLRLKEKLKTAAELNMIFTTRKLKTCLPPLKSGFEMHLKSHVFYQIICRGCISTYVGQTCRHIATRLSGIKTQISQFDKM